MKDTISERLKTALNARNMKQSDLVKKTGITKGSISSYISGKYIPKNENIKLMAAALEVSYTWLAGDSEDMDVDFGYEVYGASTVSAKKSTINVLGEVAAGIPIEAVESIERTIPVSASMADSGDYFGLIIKGDSMSPRILPGDIVIVKQQNDAENGDLVIALIKNESAACKRLMKYQGGISLISFNPVYQPMNFTSEEVSTLPVRIIGKVVELRAEF